MSLKKEDINHILLHHLKSDNFKFVSCESSNKEVSIGFQSAQEKLCIKYSLPGRSEEEICLFIKKLPDSPYQRQNLIANGGFHREVLLYNKILDSFHEQFLHDCIPKCFLARTDDIIVLEDLSYKGYKNKSINEPLDLLHCEKALETIAKFHSASLIFEKKEKCKIIDIVPIIQTEVVMSKEINTQRKSVLNGIKALKKVTETYLAHYQTDLINKAFYYMENLFDQLKCSNSCQNVLCHSDLWVNNIMFKYDDKGKVNGTCIIDFQLGTYKAPSYDIQLFLHTCTTKELRDKHYCHLLKHYFNALVKHLSLFSVGKNCAISWKEFESMLEETLPVVISLAPLFIHFILMPNNIVKEVLESDTKFKYYFEEDRTEYVLRAMTEDENYKQRLLQSMTEFFNYFNFH